MKSLQAKIHFDYANSKLVGSLILLLTAFVVVAEGACRESAAAVKNETRLPVNDTTPTSPAAKGIPPKIAKFFAATRLDSKCPNDTTCVFLQTFPNRATRQITLRVSPGQKYAAGPVTPGSIPISGFKFALRRDANSTVRMDLNYHVAPEGLPSGPAKTGQASPLRSEELVAVPLVQFAALRTEEPRGPALMQLATSPIQSEGAGVYWGEIGKKGYDVANSAYFDYAKELGIKGARAIGSIYALASTLAAISEALELSKQHREWLKELDALEKCAANPTNRLARKDPNYSKTAVAIVQAARAELTEVTGVRFLNQMTEKSAELTPVTAVMSIGLKQGFAWSEQTLTDYSDNTIMKEAEHAVVKCKHPAYKVAPEQVEAVLPGGLSVGEYSAGTICLEQPFTVTFGSSERTATGGGTFETKANGQMQFTPSSPEGGNVNVTGAGDWQTSVNSARLHGEWAGKGNYTVDMPGKETRLLIHAVLGGSLTAVEEDGEKTNMPLPPGDSDISVSLVPDDTKECDEP